MMAVNPYESPVTYPEPLPADLAPKRPIDWIRFPATALIVLTGIQIVALAVFALRVYFFLLSSERMTIFKLIEAPEFRAPVLSILCCLFICVGAFRIWELRSLWFCRAAAIAACLPLVTPFFCIGIPFGIWSTILLFRKDVAAKFDRP